MSHPLAAVLFDLDGTLIDTAPDFLYCLNILRQRRDLAELSIQDMRHHVSHGSIGIIREGLGIPPEHAEFNDLRQEFLSLYTRNICSQSRLFSGIKKTLQYLSQQGIVWGIVTNKPERFTPALLKKIDLPHAPACVVCGDTAPKPKPHPEPMYHACRLLDVLPEACLFIGDSVHDITAGRSANMPTVLAQYGYIDPQQDASTWQADFSIDTPYDLKPLIHKLLTGTGES